MPSGAAACNLCRCTTTLNWSKASHLDCLRAASPEPGRVLQHVRLVRAAGSLGAGGRVVVRARLRDDDAVDPGAADGQQHRQQLEHPPPADMSSVTLVMSLDHVCQAIQDGVGSGSGRCAVVSARQTAYLWPRGSGMYSLRKYWLKRTISTSTGSPGQPRNCHVRHQIP